MPDWLTVLLILPATFLLARCWMSFLSGERVSGSCGLCVLLSAVAYLVWTKSWLGLDSVVLWLLSDLPAEHGFFQPDSVMGTLVMAGGIFALAFGTLHFFAWLVRRWDRRRFSRGIRYLHGSCFLPLYFLNRGASDGARLESAPSDPNAADCSPGDVGGDADLDAGGID